MTNIERARAFVRANYSDASVYTLAERRLAFACYLQGLIDKAQASEVTIKWQGSTEKSLFALDGEAVIARCNYNGETRYEIGFYHDGVKTFTTLYKGLSKEYSLLPEQGWNCAPRTMPRDVKVAVIRYTGGVDDHIYRVVENEREWGMAMIGATNHEYLKIE